MSDEFPFHHGRVCLSFAGTLGKRASVAEERVPDAAALDRWLRVAGLDVAGQRVPPQRFRQYIALREAIARVAGALADRRKPDAGDVALINDAVSRWYAAPSLVQNGAHLTIAPVTNVMYAAGRIAADAVELFSGADAAKLRRCDLETCGAIFVDAGGRRARRWCSTARCGNIARVRAHRQRERT